MEIASPPRKLLFQENFSSKKRNHLWNLLLLQENFSAKKRNHLWNLLLLQENFSSKKTSPPRKEITYGIILLELESR
jgi:hypothetical protein